MLWYRSAAGKKSGLSWHLSFKRLRCQLPYNLPYPTVINGPVEIIDMIRISKLGGADQRRGYPDPHCWAPSLVTLICRYGLDIGSSQQSDKSLSRAVIDVPPELLGGDLLNTNDAFNLYVKSDISKVPLPTALLLLGSGLPGSIGSAMT